MNHLYRVNAKTETLRKSTRFKLTFSGIEIYLQSKSMSNKSSFGQLVIQKNCHG